MVFMPGRRLRSASSQQVAEVTKYVGCAVASAVAGCGELCVCVCVFFPFILDIKFVGRASRGHTGGRSHRRKVTQDFSSTFFLRCVPSREKDSAIPFPRRP